MENSKPVCVYCGLAFAFNCELATHISGAHLDNVFHCDVCDAVRYETKEEFTLHVQGHLTANCLDDEHNFNLMPVLVEVNGRSKYRSYVEENSNVFTCNICDRDFTRHLDLKRHLTTHQTNYASKSKKSGVRHPCNVCEQIFTRRCDLAVHVRKKHQSGNTSKNKCLNATEDTFALNTQLDSNIDLNHIENNQLTQPCLVQIQNSETNTPDLLLILPAPPWFNINRNTDKDIALLGSQGIKQEDSDSQVEEDMIEDASVDINGQTVYSCTHCERYIKSRSAFVKHLRIHSRAKPFICHLCGKQFRALTLLNSHVRDAHGRVKKFPCDICDRKFAYLHTRDDHRRTHTGECPCVCDVCGKGLKSKSSLYFHMRFHSNVFPYVCGYCDKRYRIRQQLKRHIMCHTGERPNPCDRCGKSFRFKSGLKKHKVNHGSKEEVECQICGKSFSQLRYLKIHVRSHNLRTLNKLHS